MEISMALSSLHLQQASPKDERTLANLFQLYFHDFSDWSGEEVDAHGKFDAWDETTFTTQGNMAYLLRVGEQLAGFLVIETAQTLMGPMKEFADLFILRRYRRAGLAPHPWLVAVFRADTQALKFWRSAFDQLPFKGIREFEDAEQPEFYFFEVQS
jgi:predicted acetyltransferase